MNCHIPRRHEGLRYRDLLADFRVGCALIFSLILGLFLTLPDTARAADDVDSPRYYTVELVVFAQDEAAALDELRQGRDSLSRPDPDTNDSVDLFRDTLSKHFSYLRKLPPGLIDPTQTYLDGEWNTFHRSQTKHPERKINEAFFSGLYDPIKTPKPASGEQVLPPREFVPLPKSWFTLNRIAESIARESSMRLLLHVAWNQHSDPFGQARKLNLHNHVEISPTAPPPAKPLWLDWVPDTSQARGRPQYELDGVATLAEGTFLHVQLDLVYRQLLPGPGPRAHWVNGRPRPFIAQHLTVRRRLTPNTLNYLDARHLGALVRVRKWAPEKARLP